MTRHAPYLIAAIIGGDEIGSVAGHGVASCGAAGGVASSAFSNNAPSPRYRPNTRIPTPASKKTTTTY